MSEQIRKLMWKTFQRSWYIVNNFHGILYIRCKKGQYSEWT